MTQTDVMMPKGARTTEAPERANDLPEWYVSIEQAEAEGIDKNLSKACKADFYCRLSDGGLLPMKRPQIITFLLFGPERWPTEEEATKAKEEAGEDYFLSVNLDLIEYDRTDLETLDELAIWRDPTNPKLRGWAVMESSRGYCSCYMSEEDRVTLIDAYTFQKVKFEKRLHRYLKRYGLSKVRKFTHFEL
nr:MAG TPA: hypothetical protein [Caudoviricetes sp.]